MQVETIKGHDLGSFSRVLIGFSHGPTFYPTSVGAL